jgi:hypothetical protein
MIFMMKSNSGRYADYFRSIVIAGMAFLLAGTASAAPWFQDDLEWNSISEAISSGPWTTRDGDVSISTDFAASGSKSLKVCYGGVEAQSYLSLDMPGVVFGNHNGKTHIFLRWKELRPTNYDWAGEKLNRIVGHFANEYVTLDYPMVWWADGYQGTAGTNGPGVIQLFGNSQYSNGANHISTTYAIPRNTWVTFELELKLNDMGQSNGESRLWIDDVLKAQVTGTVFRYPQNPAFTMDRIWMGGWWSPAGGPGPSPGPACRYIDDVSVSDTRSGSNTSVAAPNPPSGIL